MLKLARSSHLLVLLLCLTFPFTVAAAPSFVSCVAASEGPGTPQSGRAFSNVTVAFAPAAAGEWSAVEVYVTGYRGSPHAVLAAGGTSSPIAFQLESTGETVRFHFVSVFDDGSRTALASSPSVGVVLDGQASPPVPVSNLAAQTVRGAVRLSWSENLEADISHYQVLARSAAAGSEFEFSESQVVASVPAAGAGATRKAMWDVAGGDAAARFYYVRAVNRSGQAGRWMPDPPATLAVGNLAPDGTSDSGTPNWNLYEGVWLGTPGEGRVQMAITRTSRWVANFRFPLNNEGIVALWVKLYYTGGDGLGSRVFRFPDSGEIVDRADGTRTFTVDLPGAVITGQEHWFENYFGQGTHVRVDYREGRGTGGPRGPRNDFELRDAPGVRPQALGRPGPLVSARLDSRA